MDTILFIATFIISVIIMTVFTIEIRKNDKTALSPFTAKLRQISGTVTIIMGITAFADGLKLIDFGTYSGAYFFMGIVCVSTYILCVLHRIHKLPAISHAVKVIFIAFVLELTIFNVPVYRMWFGNYPTVTCKISRSILEDGGTFRETEKDIAVKDGENLVLKLPDINRPVSTIYVDVELADGTRAVDFWIDATDETQSFSPRENIAKTIISRHQPQSHYLQCELSGNVGELIIHLKPQNYGSAYLKGITLNMPVAMEISWIRFLLIVLLSIFIRAVLKGRIMQKSITENLVFCKNTAVIITAFMCFCAVWTSNYRIDGRTWKEEFSQTSGSQVTQQLVEAFADGRTYLYPQPDENLNNFDNPYDKQHREAELVPKWKNDYATKYAWDHVYFNGKFYSYYGIAPVVLLFLPYHIMTGYYFPESGAVLIFSLIGIIGLSFMFMKTVRKFFPELPTGIFIAGLVIIQMSSGIWYSIGRPLFYEVAMSSGFAFMTWAVYFLISANIIGKGRISLYKTAISSLLFALAVLSRPTTVLYCICAFVFMMCAVPKLSDGKQKLFSRQNGKYLACAIVPMACLGLVQMIYNYARFGSPFEFGIQYSLTINDFRNTQFHWQLSLIPFWNYLFNPPVFSAKYPFISANFQDMGVGGFFYNDSPSIHNVCGLFFLALPMFAYILSGKALKTIPDRRDRITKLMYILFPCVIIPLIIICSVWESGYSIRYMTDFAWQMITGAYAVIFCLYIKSSDPTVKKIISIFFCVSLVWTIVVGGVQSVNQAFRYCDMHLDYPEIAYEVQKVLMFWK